MVITVMLIIMVLWSYRMLPLPALLWSLLLRILRCLRLLGYISGHLLKSRRMMALMRSSSSPPEAPKSNSGPHGGPKVEAKKSGVPVGVCVPQAPKDSIGSKNVSRDKAKKPVTTRHLPGGIASAARLSAIPKVVNRTFKR